MAYQVLARKYRPQLFSDVIGQDHVTRTLLNALAQNRIAHGYIFSGHRGIGKTTIARILAAALNCSTPVGSPERPTEEPCRICVNCREISSASRQENSIFEESHSFDVEEIDAATNRGIDDARLLTSKIQTRPTNKSKYKIIILDEAHQITDAAWNALLKTLEEPPDWAIFMFATTQPEDIPQTIRSRCQHFSFHAVKLDDIVGQLRSIAIKEELTVDDATLTLLAEAGDGSMRDALSIMDQAIASAPIVNDHPHLEITQVRELMGSVSNVVYEQVLEAVHANNSADVLSVVGRLLDAGNGAPQLARQFVRYLRNTIVAKVTNLAPDADATGIAADLLQISPEERHRAARSAALFTEEDLSRFLAIMLRTFDELGFRQEQRFHLELGLLKLVHVQRLIPIEDLLSQLGAKPSSTPNTKPTTPKTPSSRPEPGSPASALARGGRDAAGRSGETPVFRPATPSATTLGAPGPDSRTRDRGATAASLPVTSPTPPPSPFESDRTRKIPTTGATSPGSPPPPTATAGSLALDSNASPIPAPLPSGPQLVVDLSAAADPDSPPTYDLSALQSAMVTALAAIKGQQSASEQLEDSTLTLKGNTLEIHTTLSKTMLPVVLNADAERTLKAALREANAGALILKFFPGAPATSAAPKKPRQAVSGSVAELAEKHPMVQEARKLFSAEISNVIDLREKE
jgi:DNA polymerase-3 subunit gamma/tau